MQRRFAHILTPVSSVFKTQEHTFCLVITGMLRMMYSTKKNVSMRQFFFCEKGVWNTSLHIVWCSKLSHYLGQYSSRLLIFHDQGFTGSKFHSSSLERLCFEQELAWNTIAPRVPDLLWGKLRLITIICSGFLGSWGQTLCSHNVRFC